MKQDPTKTLTLRNMFQRKLTARFKLLNKRIQDLLITKDVFGLKVSSQLSFNQEVGNREWSFLTDERKVEEFEVWLQNETGLVIQPAGDVWEEFVIQGYQKGAGRAYDQVNKSKVASAEASSKSFAFAAGQRNQFIQGMVAPESVGKVKLLAQRVFTDLTGVTEVMATQIRKELLDGLVQGDNPNTIGMRISERTGSSVKHAQRIARTEIIRAHAEGQLDALEKLGVQEVGVQVEWDTAGDDRVCPICAPLNATTYKIKDAHGLIPAHPNCRCAFVPFI